MRLKPVIVLLALCAGASGPWAAEATPPVESNTAEQARPECNSCTARHQALLRKKKLREQKAKERKPKLQSDQQQTQ